MIILMMIEDLLADLGCASVTATATVDQALVLIEAQSFDVATLDVNLGGGDSYPIADALAVRGVPFVFSTGCFEHSLRGDHRNRPVLRKPFRPKEFIRILATLITHATSAPAGEGVVGG